MSNPKIEIPFEKVKELECKLGFKNLKLPLKH